MKLKINNYDNLMKYLEQNAIIYLIDEPMKKHTTFGIGGPVDVIIFPKRIEELLQIIKIIKKNKLNFHFMGSGSNVLVSDDGIKGVIISLKKSFKEVTFSKNKVYAQSGVMLGNFVKQLIGKNITGYESLIGVPGTLGGALIMNAGAYGSEISNNIISVRTLCLNGEIKTYQSEDINFSYRESSFKNNEIIIDAYFNCKYGDRVDIQKNKLSSSKSRKDNQPLKFRSAGSIFKNPSDTLAAGYLIDKVGLKGSEHGGASISEKHANFIVNMGGATAADVFHLIKLAKRKVAENFHINLELEVKLIGFPKTMTQEVYHA